MYMSIINTSSNTISSTKHDSITIIITTSQSILLKQYSTSHFISSIKHLRSSRSNNWVSILTNLLGDLPADPDWHLLVDSLAVLLGHILALIIGILLACAGNGSPDLVIAKTLPLVLAVLLVLGGALSLRVGLILCLVLLHTHALVHRLALLLIDCVALLPGGGLAQSLCLSTAHLLILSRAHLSLS